VLVDLQIALTFPGWGRDFSLDQFQNGYGTHSASSVGTRVSFPRAYRGWGMNLSTRLHAAPRLRVQM